MIAAVWVEAGRADADGHVVHGVPLAPAVLTGISRGGFGHHHRGGDERCADTDRSDDILHSSGFLFGCFVCDLYCEIAQIRYFARLGGIGAKVIEVTDLRYANHQRVQVSTTNPDHVSAERRACQWLLKYTNRRASGQLLSMASSTTDSTSGWALARSSVSRMMARITMPRE